ncbi:MAG: acetylglutamate kinase [Chloroflexi bacterium]|nr:MAG: acetylglutamate kinase [Chloroflexota bacterium]
MNEAMGVPATVIKIGGSTLGAQDTSLQDVVQLHREGMRPVVVHGGGAMISDWLKRLDIESHFVDGLRSTSAPAMEVVLGVLRGVVNTQLVGEIIALGGRAVGLSGVDGAIVRGEQYDERLGLVGRITEANADILNSLLDAGVIPVIAPIALEAPSQALNINADTMAGEIARALNAAQLIFLTDVDGLMDGTGAVVESLGAEQAQRLRADGVLSGGMIPKIDACFRAAEVGVAAFIANGTQPHTVHRLVSGEQIGTRIEV